MQNYILGCDICSGFAISEVEELEVKEQGVNLIAQRDLLHVQIVKVGRDQSVIGNDKQPVESVDPVKICVSGLKNNGGNVLLRLSRLDDNLFILEIAEHNGLSRIRLSDRYYIINLD